MKKTNEMSQNTGLKKGKAIFLSAISLNQFKLSDTNNNAIAKAIHATTKDSLKNCLINCPRTEPIDLRIPTSFALFSEWAVLRFIKLIQASSNTKEAIIPNNHTI